MKLWRRFVFALLFGGIVGFGLQTGHADDPKDKSPDSKKDDKKKADDKKTDDKKSADDQKAELQKKIDEARKRAEDLRKKADEALKNLEELKKKSGVPARLPEDLKKRAEEAKKKFEEHNKKAEEIKKKREEEAAKRKADEEAYKKRVASFKVLDDLPKAKDGSFLLFDGKDFNNWRVGSDPKGSLDGKTETADKHYVADKDGIVVDAGDRKPTQDLVSVKEVSKLFQVKFEFKPIDDGRCYFNFGGQPIHLRDYTKPSQHGGAPKLKNFKSGEWNEVEITVQNGPYTASLDRKPLTDKDVVDITFREGKPELKINGKPADVFNFSIDRGGPIATVKCNGEDLQKATMGSGTFGRPLHGQISIRPDKGKVEIRNVRIKEVN